MVSDLLVQVYSGISHSDSVTVVPSFYFYFKVARQGKDRWLSPPSGCSQRTLGVVASCSQRIGELELPSGL
jgi:hypothetical protein